MKKFVWIISIIVYLISANALVHASSMGFFEQDQNTASYCHQIHTTTNQTAPDQNNIDCCCELVYSNEYSIIKITFKNFQKKYFSFVLPSTNHFFLNQKTISYKSSIIESPPWRKTDNKYNNFSDLAWIIVNII